MDLSNFWWSGAGGGPGPGPDPGDPVGESLRFRGAQQQLLAFESFPSTTKVDACFSFWIKLGVQTTSTTSLYQSMLCYSRQSGGIDFRISNNGQFHDGAVHPGTQYYRDNSGWYHCFIRYTESSGLQEVYVNGVLQYSNSYSYSNALNGTRLEIGNTMAYPSSYFQYVGYMADYHYVYGQSLSPETFGRFNAKGVWVPVDPGKDGDTTWYGANGFHLTFPPGNIGRDQSGNGNDFTATGFETTDQTSPNYDIVQDSPTNNFATINPLHYNDGVALVINDANLSSSTTGGAPTPASTHIITGKTYVEFYECNYYVGIWRADVWDTTDFVGFRPDEFGIYYAPGSVWSNNVQTGASTSSFATSDVLALTYDPDTGEAHFYINNVVQNSGNPIHTLTPSEQYVFVLNQQSAKGYINCGQQPFRYTPPAGFLALSTANMPTDELPDTITGEFIGNSNADGPFVYTGCIPARIQYGTIDVKYQDRFGQTNVDFLSNGFKVRSTTSNSGTVNYTVTTTHDGGEYDGNKVPFQSPAPAVSN